MTNLTTFLETASIGVPPWQENYAIDVIMVGIFIFLIAGIWLWSWSGRSKREKKVPFERTAEDFAGTVQAAYGQIPNFLILIYAAVIISVVGYIIVSIISGVQY
jgi:hypothetical protein